jgi:hypothetical protein
MFAEQALYLLSYTSSQPPSSQLPFPIFLTTLDIKLSFNILSL